MLRLILLFALFALPLRAETEVDVELFLAVDVSRSMSPGELEIQRRGYAEALSSDEVIAAITGGMIGRIALTYVEWAGSDSQRVIVPWTLVDSPDSARTVAATLSASFSSGMRRTSISGAIGYAADSFEDNGFFAFRRVIDISGDGPNNQGPLVLPARDAALAKGLVINGLPLMTREGMGGAWHLEDLDAYYRACVIGGPGAFVIPVHGWPQFADAVRRKLILEIAAPRLPAARIFRAQLQGGAGYDCEIGEKIWRDRMRYWDDF